MFKKTLTLTLLLFAALTLPSDAQQYADARGGSDRNYTAVRREQQLLKNEGAILRDILVSSGDQTNVVQQLMNNVKKTKALEKELQVFYTRPGERLMSRPDKVEQAWIFPVQGHGGVTATYKDPSYYRTFWVDHDGIDLRLPQKSTLRAMRDGIIIEASANGYGFNWVKIDHGEYQVLYGHVNKIMVEEGQRVMQGETIGLSGGKRGTLGAGMSTGPHLHFELYKNGELTNPEELLGDMILLAEDEGLKRS